jgi:hypothetical protein
VPTLATAPPSTFSSVAVSPPTLSVVVEPGGTTDIYLHYSTEPVMDSESDMELWKLVAPSAYDHAKMYVRKQLPLHGDFLGLQWCSEDVSKGFAQ